MRPKVYLICNAHLDPVWQWEWQEGAAEALSTFRTAAGLCEQFDGFVFNHNEAILYEWVEQYDPDLFKRIQRLVEGGRWHIMGGWYLQPDCNMPSGEALVRQIMVGRQYFEEKFGERPTTAINFDPFGHSRGMVQILVQTGYDSYLFCRPGQEDCFLPESEFEWIGYDGSSVLASRPGFYNSPLGKAAQKVQDWLQENSEKNVGAVLWGVGDHGGGPSRKDLRDINELIKHRDDINIIHSTPEEYFQSLRDNKDSFPRYEKDLNPWAVGCYTSQIRVKQQYRRLENELFLTEKICSAAAALGLMDYPAGPLREAQKDMLTAQFHDILPGSSIQSVEESSLQMMNHGLEILGREKAKAFFAMAGSQPAPKNDKIPILVYNPHPHRVETVVECEFQLADQNLAGSWTIPTVFQGDKELPTNLEKEDGNLDLDWRKRVAFKATLEPSAMNRFDCILNEVEEKPRVVKDLSGEDFVFETEDLYLVVNGATGLMDDYRVEGEGFIKENGFLPLVMQDDEDPWGMNVSCFRDLAGEFSLMGATEAAEFAGVRRQELSPIRVIEDGPVRTVVEVLMSYGNSRICQRYKLPKEGTEIEVEVRVYWGEKNSMLKLSVPTAFGSGRYLGEVVYGREELPSNGQEVVAQKWSAAVSEENNTALTCINDGTYGSDFKEGEIRLSLLRSPAYVGHPVGDDKDIVSQDRFLPRIDQGERIFRFWVKGGDKEERLESVPREAQYHNEKPFALSFFPAGGGEAPESFLILRDEVIQMTACKKAEDGEGFVVRLFNPTDRKRRTILDVRPGSIQYKIEFGPYEVKTFGFSPKNGAISELNLLEE